MIDELTGNRFNEGSTAVADILQQYPVALLVPAVSGQD